MRPILRSDIEQCVRAVQAAGLDAGADVMKRLLANADLADRYRRRTGRLHLQFGDGSLGYVARKQDRTRASAVCDRDFCLALGVVVQQIMVWSLEQSDRGAENG